MLWHSGVFALPLPGPLSGIGNSENIAQWHRLLFLKAPWKFARYWICRPATSLGPKDQMRFGTDDHSTCDCLLSSPPLLFPESQAVKLKELCHDCGFKGHDVKGCMRRAPAAKDAESQDGVKSMKKGGGGAVPLRPPPSNRALQCGALGRKNGARGGCSRVGGGQRYMANGERRTPQYVQ